ncbi:MAG: DUF285 domain-containing protein [Proteobacteria bacterium]|nr:DUF285 domain-containing protein [Pseudomonadota bacterium]
MKLQRIPCILSLPLPTLLLCGCHTSATNERPPQNADSQTATAPAAESAPAAAKTLPAHLQAIVQNRKDRAPIDDISKVRPLVFVVSIPVDGFTYFLDSYNALPNEERAALNQDFPDFKPNFEIDFDGDGVYETQNALSFTYPKAGTYRVSIRGELAAIQIGYKEIMVMDAPPDKFKRPEPEVLDIQQWGDIRWKSMTDFANNCKHLMISATDTPDLTDVRSLAFMFANTELMNADLSFWDISNVTSLRGTFQNAKAFNQPLNDWDTSNITDLTSTFEGAAAFNQPLDKWNVSKVTLMNRTFQHAYAFNQPLNDWDTSSITELEHAFWGAKSFNQPLDHWDVSHVTSFYETFRDAHAFNQPLEAWNVSSARTFSGMFSGAAAFNQPLEAWNVSNVTSMWYMFEGAENFNQPLEKWDVSNVDNTNDMFSKAIRFNQPLNAWNTRSLKRMNHMFERAISFNQPLDAWDVSSVTEMYGAFDAAVSFNQPLDTWNVSEQAAKTAKDLLKGARSYAQKLPEWLPPQDLQANDWWANDKLKSLGRAQADK